MDPVTAGMMSGGFGGLDMGGGSITPSSSATATNTGGTNTVGGTVFGNYNPPSTQSTVSSMVPWIVGGAVVLGAVFLLKGGK